MPNYLRYERLTTRPGEATTRFFVTPKFFGFERGDYTQALSNHHRFELSETLRAIGPLAPTLLVIAARQIRVRWRDDFEKQPTHRLESLIGG